MANKKQAAKVNKRTAKQDHADKVLEIVRTNLNAIGTNLSKAEKSLKKHKEIQVETERDLGYVKTNLAVAKKSLPKTPKAK
jgi:5-bromo-4-chloroindolyl phosphate hydrolysis protein